MNAMAAQIEGAERMMTRVRASKRGLNLAFADGATGTIPFADIPEVAGLEDLDSIRLPNPYEVVLHTRDGESLELPWDFGRHYCDAAYRERVEAVAASGRAALGEHIRRLRQQAGLSQEQVAQAAGLSRITLVRIEKGERSPRYQTLESLAAALGCELGELLTPAEV